MFHMVMLILDDLERVHDVLNSWEAVGARGITIMESTGLGRVRNSTLREGFGLMPSLERILRSAEEKHRTMFSVVKTEEMVDKLIAATEGVVGSLSEPNIGVIFVIPVARVVGAMGFEDEEHG